MGQQQDTPGVHHSLPVVTKVDFSSFLQETGGVGWKAPSISLWPGLVPLADRQNSDPESLYWNLHPGATEV